MIPTTNALLRWRLNVEMKTKLTLRSSRQLSFNELTNAKILSCIVTILFQLTLLHSWELDGRFSDGIWKRRILSFKCFVDHSHTMYSSEIIYVRNWVHLFKSLCIFWKYIVVYVIQGTVNFKGHLISRVVAVIIMQLRWNDIDRGRPKWWEKNLS